MKFTLKLIADLSFYFTLVPALAVLAMFVSPSIPFFIWVVPAVVYVVYAITHYRIFAVNVRYKAVFMLYLKIFAGFAVFMIIGDGINIFGTYIMPTALVFFASSITLMRFSRHSDSVQKQLSYKLVSGGSVAVLVLAAVAMSLFWASGLMRVVLAFLYHRVFVAAIMLIIRVLLFIFRPIIEWLLGRELTQPEEYYMPPDVYFGEEEDFFTFSEYDASHAAMVLGAAIAVGILLCILWLVFKKLTHSPPLIVNEAGVIQEYMAIEETTQRAVKQKNKLRRYYQRFLSVCRKRGIPIEVHYTSETYKQLAAETFGAEDGLNRLREIYLPVRYGGESKENASQEDIDFAKKFVGKLKRMRKQG